MNKPYKPDADNRIGAPPTYWIFPGWVYALAGALVFALGYCMSWVTGP